MAATLDVKNEELNSIFKSLAERGKDGEIFKKYNDWFTRSRLPQLSSGNSKFDNNPIVFQAYGSAAEDLQSYDPCDAGDMDFMVFSNSDDLLIHEEMLEYLLENPLHVRIKGSDHPVLQSCLVEDTEYVATSAVKNLHPAIFGSVLDIDLFSGICQFVSSEPHFTAYLNNHATSPAVTLNISNLLGRRISKYQEVLKVDSGNFPINKAAAEVECIVHFLCVYNGIDFTREHAELLNDFLLFIKDAAEMRSSSTHLLFFPQIFDRLTKLDARLRDINSRSRHTVVHTNGQQVVTPKPSDQKESAEKVVYCSGATFSSYDKPHASVAPQNCVIAQRKLPEDLEFTLSQSTMPRDSSKNSHRFSEKTMSNVLTRSQVVERNSEETEMNADYNEQESELKAKRNFLAQTGEVASKDLPRNPDGKEEKEKRELKRRYYRWLDIMFETIAEKMVTKSNDIGQITSGADFIPAFRSLGWPKVAKEWIKRERKWPSHEMVEKVIKEGFHLVVKSPKVDGNPECDFRISFSHAEYLLSQEMNDIQRECYRCLKKYHRAYLSTQPKSLVSFHLKNIFLQTIEETGPEMWNESKRGECMMKLFGNLLEALTKKELRHFFVRSYNLFREDYIENPEILEFLARKVQEIMENPVLFAKQLVQSQEDTKQKEECVPNNKIPMSESSQSGKPVAGQRHDDSEEFPSKGNCDTQCTKEKVTVPLCPTKATQECCPDHRYHELHDIYQEVTKKLVDVAFYAMPTDCRLEALDPLERSLVEELGELVKKNKIPVGVFPEVFNSFWHKRAYYWIWISTEPDTKHRVLVAIQGVVEILKFFLKEDNFRQAENGEALEALVDRMLDYSEKKISDMLPPGSFIQFLNKAFNTVGKRSQPQVNSKIPSVESLGYLVRKYFGLSKPEEDLDLLDNCLSLLSDDSDAGVQGLLESMKRFALKEDHSSEGISRDSRNIFVDAINSLLNSFISRSAQPNDVHDVQAEENEAPADFPKMVIDLMKMILNSFSEKPAQPKDVYNSDDIPLD